MPEEEKPQETAAKTETASPELEALARVLEQRPQELEALLARVFQQRLGISTSTGRSAGALQLSDAQKEIEASAAQFRDQTAGPSGEQLADSTQAPPSNTDIYGNDPPDWARQRRRSLRSRS
jgi:hypothetical protein